MNGGVLPDSWFIEEYRRSKFIEPFIAEKVGKGKISYGVSSFGYDARISNEFKIFTNVHCGIIDAKNFSNKNFVDIIENQADHILIPPNSFALGRTIEYLKIPRDVIVICLGKSTYARCGLIVNVTPLEPEWEGFITIEISNTTPLPAKIYINEGICQCVFLRSAIGNCDVSYKDQAGKYMHQKGIVMPCV